MAHRVAGVMVEYDFKKYEDFVPEGSSISELIPDMNLHMVPRLNEVRTPESIRQRFLELCSQ